MAAKMATALIKTHMLVWARERAGLSIPEIASKMGEKEARIHEWESGQKQMTFNQAMKYAEKAHVPFGYFFVDTPPVEQLPVADLRTIGDANIGHYSLELTDLLKMMLECQIWYRDYMKANLIEPVSVVKSYSINSSVMDVVEDMRQKLSVGKYPTRGNYESYYRDLVNKIEELGILVMRQSNLGHFTRPLLVEEFRGFALTDNYAPIIFVNHSDVPSARLFTLIHELCHIWVGYTGVSDGSPQNHRNEEKFCNAVAAEFLVPQDEFSELWNHQLEDWRSNISPLVDHFRVSRWVIARKALSLSFISNAEFGRYIAMIKAEYDSRSNKNDAGPSYWVVKKSQLSTIFAKAVVRQAINGQILMRDAGWMLSINPSKVNTFAKELGI